MSEVNESFSPGEGSEGADGAALERLREQMRNAQAAMKRDQQQELKQHQTEEDLYLVLIQLINKLGEKHPLVIYIVKCLSDNMLAELILACLSINFPEIRGKVNLKFYEPISDTETPDTQSLIVPDLDSDSTTPLHVKLNLDSWIRCVNTIVFKNPSRNLEAIRHPKTPDKAKHSITDLLSFMAQYYLQTENVNFIGENIDKFMRILGANLIERLDQFLKSQQVSQSQLEAEQNESNSN